MITCGHCHSGKWKLTITYQGDRDWNCMTCGAPVWPDEDDPDKSVNEAKLESLCNELKKQVKALEQG